MATWKQLIEEAAQGDMITHCTLTDAEINEEFDDDFGASNGRPFTAWSNSYVYFPVVYDGAEWVGRAPRNPNGEVTPHQGGE